MTSSAKGTAITVQCPHWFRRQDFRELLAKYTEPPARERRLATWHHGGETPSEFSDASTLQSC